MPCSRSADSPSSSSAKSILEDQLEAVQRTSVERGDGRLDLALLTDGLRAEREQGITIDVAYRFFASEKRKFIVAEMRASRTSEREGRVIDHDAAASMEKKKQEGYF